MRTAPSDLAGLARFILSNECQHVAILSGAGMSCASGIPDFRSPGGMYDTLQPHLITATEQQRQLMRQDPTNVVTWDMFQQNAFPYLEVRRPFILGTRDRKWKATVAHRFAELLHVKLHKLRRIFTQNIDGLDFQCDQIPRDKIVPVHGTLGRVACEGCGAEADYNRFCHQVQTQIKDIYKAKEGDDNDNDVAATAPPAAAPKESTPILCEQCRKPLVKPTTVLFGRSLPEEFFVRLEQDLPKLDLLIVAGTSLVVSPANTLVPYAADKTIRVVVNREPVGVELGLDFANPASRDCFAQGDCDDVFLELCKELGWLDDLKPDLLPPESAEKVRKAQQDTAYQKWF